MNVCPVVNYAVEDGLSGAVMGRCLRECRLQPGVVLGGHGFGDLKRISPGLNRASAVVPYVVLTDLDRFPCPPALVQDWLGEVCCSDRFLLRIAVREVESWLLADIDGVADFLGVSRSHLPREPEACMDPKLELLKAARRCRRRFLREGLVAEADWGPVQGPNYNDALAEFVDRRWSVELAQSKSLSLDKAITRLEGLRLICERQPKIMQRPI